jgi:hypothetical protein
MYTKYITVIVYALIISAFLNFGCNSSSFKKESGKDKIKSYNDYFPVNEGNKWEYVNEGPRDETELFKVQINNLKYDENDQIIELSSFPFFSRQEEKTTLRIKPNGEVYLVNKQTQKDELFIPETGNFKKEFQWQFGQWSGLIGGTNETVKAENETFNNCIFLNFSIFYTFSAEIWVAKDKGIVKWGYNRTNPPTLKPQYYVLNKLSLAK